VRKPRNASLARIGALAAVLVLGCVPALSARAAEGEGQGSQTIVTPPPTVTIASPVNGASYALGDAVAASYSCAAHGSAHITACTGPVANGALIPTTGLGEHSFTVSATDSNGGTATRTVVYLVSAGPSPPLSSAPPTISEVTQSTQAWHEGRTVPLISRTAPAVGTMFSFSLNEPAAVSFSFTRGGGVAGPERCTRANQKALAAKQTCLRTVARGEFAFPAHAGANRVSFQGLLSASTKLRPGRYTLVLKATDTAGRSAAAAPLSLTILP